MTNFLMLFGQPFLACLIMIAILGYLGLHVIKREIIFIDISLAQIAAVGAIGAHLVFHVHGDSFIGYVSAFAFTFGAALFYAFARKKITNIPLEAVIGVTYAIAAAGALFLVGIAPGGHVHIQEMLAGSILWVSWKEVVSSFVVFLFVGSVFYVFRAPFEKISNEYEKALREGMNVIGWDLLFYAFLGIVVTVSVRICGVILVFSFLIIPATLSAIFSSSWKKRLLISWGSGIIAVILGFLFSNQFDFSVGPSITLFLGIELVLAGILTVVTKKIKLETFDGGHDGPSA
ncbi:MAG: metal ABC transporter permease [Candidatus Theseobacter exili]|nr:metal ABC transporter permease [Candidatus Theseobacter exili]